MCLSLPARKELCAALRCAVTFGICVNDGLTLLPRTVVHAPSGAAVQRPGKMIVCCNGCQKPITGKFLVTVLERTWHAECVRCTDCGCALTDKCFSREGKLFCRSDFFR